MTNSKFRHLSRDSAHRRALLRNLATSLIEHESITTTWHKAKEAQRWVEKLITLGKKNTNASRTKAQGMIFDEQHKFMPKIFGELAERYSTRAGGYTRVLRTESHKDDAAESAILSLVDGPRDMRFAMTAKAIARHEAKGESLSELTFLNMHKVTKFRKNGEAELRQAVQTMTEAEELEADYMKFENEDDGTQFEWTRTGLNAGPGKVKKVWIGNTEPGADPTGLVKRMGGRPKDKWAEKLLEQRRVAAEEKMALAAAEEEKKRAAAEELKAPSAAA
jgi:large subunit ribosomal protein L17